MSKQAKQSKASWKRQPVSRPSHLRLFMKTVKDKEKN